MKWCLSVYFSHDSWCWAFFHLFIGHLYIILEEISLEILGHFKIGLFVFLLLSCKSSLQTYFMLLCFTDSAFFTNWKSVAILHWANLSVPFFQQRLPTSCRPVTFWLFLTVFRTFSWLLCLLRWYMIIGVWWYYHNSLKAQWWLAVFSNKVFFLISFF